MRIFRWLPVRNASNVTPRVERWRLVKTPGEALGGVGQIGDVDALEGCEEFGGSAFPIVFFMGKGGDLAGQGIGAERHAHLRRSDSERGRSGEGPLKGVGKTRGEFGADRADIAEGEGDRCAGSGEQSGARAFELKEDFAFRTALRRDYRRQVYGDGVVGESGFVAAGAVTGSGQDDGALKADGDRVGRVGGLIEFEGRTGGKAGARLVRQSGDRRSRRRRGHNCSKPGA